MLRVCNTSDAVCLMTNKGISLVTVQSYRTNDLGCNPYNWLGTIEQDFQVLFRLMLFKPLQEESTSLGEDEFKPSILAERFLKELECRKRDGGTRQRPTILIGYSFGGHIIKEVSKFAF